MNCDYREFVAFPDSKMRDRYANGCSLISLGDSSETNADIRLGNRKWCNSAAERVFKFIIRKRGEATDIRALRGELLESVIRDAQ